MKEGNKSKNNENRERELMKNWVKKKKEDKYLTKEDRYKELMRKKNNWERCHTKSCFTEWGKYWNN